jgi:hypothetical protein
VDIRAPVTLMDLGGTMAQITRLDSFTVPLGGQGIELQQLDHEGGGMSMLRIRIRERSRFTVFDIDPLTAQHWGEAMTRWAGLQSTAGAPPAADGSAGDA